MTIFIITVEAVATLLGIGVLGFWIIGKKHVPENTLSFLSSLAIDIALPFLVIANLVLEFSPQKYPDWWHMPLWWAGLTAVLLILSLASSFMVKRDIRSEFTMSLFFQNGLFFPILIIIGLFGPGSSYLVTLFLFMILQPSMVFSTYILFFRSAVKKESLNWRKIVNPVLIATVIGLLIGLTSIGKYIPSFLVNIFTMVGAMATPIFMLILGGNIYNDFALQKEEQQKFRAWDVTKFVLMKNVIFPLVLLGLLLLLRPDPAIAFIIMLQAAVPPITAIPILTARCGGNKSISSQFIVASFLCSILTIPAFIFVFSRFFTLPL
jgi:predicted permease